MDQEKGQLIFLKPTHPGAATRISLSPFCPNAQNRSLLVEKTFVAYGKRQVAKLVTLNGLSSAARELW